MDMVKNFLGKRNLWLASLVLFMVLAATAISFAPQGARPAAASSDEISGAVGTARYLPARQAGTVEIIIKFKSSANSAAKDAAVRGVNATTVRDLLQLNSRVVSVPAPAGAQVLSALSKNTSVQRAATAVQVTATGTPNDSGYAQQWALPKIAWDEAYGNIAITGAANIAVLDTGVDASHPDLAGIVGAGQSFVGGAANTDPHGHGTALAGIAAASVNNETGMAGVAYAGASVSSAPGHDSSGPPASVPGAPMRLAGYLPFLPVLPAHSGQRP